VAAPVPRPPELLNLAVALLPESDRDARLFYEFSPLHIVRWAQCPRCRRRFWYALNTDTPQEELWYHGATFRQQLLGQSCEAHAEAGAPDAGARG